MPSRGSRKTSTCAICARVWKSLGVCKEAVGRLCLLRLRSLRRHNGVFRGFGYPELPSLLRGDFDRCACSRVSTHPRLAVHTDQSPESGQDEQAVLLDLGDGYVGECVQQALRHFLGDLTRVCEGLDDLRLCHHDSLIPAYADELMVRQYRAISKSLEAALVGPQVTATISSSVSGDSPVDVFACVVSSSPIIAVQISGLTAGRSGERRPVRG